MYGRYLCVLTIMVLPLRGSIRGYGKTKQKNPPLKWHGHQHWYTACGRSTAEPAGYTKSQKNFDFVVVYNNNGHLGSLQQSYQWISRFLSKKNPFVTTTISPTYITTMPRMRYTKKNHTPNVGIRQFGSCNNFLQAWNPRQTLPSDLDCLTSWHFLLLHTLRNVDM